MRHEKIVEQFLIYYKYEGKGVSV
ncbi:hypothetical protein RO1_38360 [Roseburia intestinalis XB6B4]|uniref:Uncharacterized protein n=1 Tax=Roseburia intestinalis XB6B4 TaxID=718255 RepID=D4L371_9FIRM|nr:hypothetical protein RO1_38360 [Roseburia intestinalis XB6B4]